MVKGRHFKPSSDKDGSWFPHIGLTQKTPESLMSSVLKESYCPKLIQQTEKKLPPIFKVREKQAVSNNFPFSVHDNRHTLENSGCYLDSGLGRKKISPEKGQHVSRNFNLWACDFIPSYLDGLSSNQIDYVYKEATIAPNLRHFPKSYNQVWDNFRPAAQSYMKPE
ncbi:testis-expressed protein 36 isoform X1 [Octodon degus]|uniref:Testis-expressed protein 36 isoform X1 n=1 Tax=Octodon degus TaxID=10160 RepID=A0A6P3V9T5_OCTDE|nr:testis-expressed protein 36 isoform X1 [Octodon degus]